MFGNLKKKILTLEMSNELLGEIGEARRLFESVVQKFTDNPKIVEDLITIFDEATTNAIRHAYKGKYGIVKVALYIEDNKNRKRFVLEVFDRGDIPEGMPMNLKDYEINLAQWFNEGKAGGIGLMVISKVADRAFWKKLNKGKCFVAIKNL